MNASAVAHVIVFAAVLVVSVVTAYWIVSTAGNAIIWIVERIRKHRNRPRDCLNCMAIHNRRRCPSCGSGDYEYL
jgi:rRNA maturation endonuclease Nob1